MHSTNYTDTFIQVADDCKAAAGVVPPERQGKTIARMQYELISSSPYRYTSDDIIFAVYAERNAIPEGERAMRRAEFFARGQACLRSSPLGKTYGWGIHHDGAARVAIYPLGSAEYARLSADPSLRQVKAMRSSR